MGENVELVLKSPDGEEDIVEIPEETWVEFEEKAREIGLEPEEVIKKLIDSYTNDPLFHAEVIAHMEEKLGHPGSNHE